MSPDQPPARTKTFSLLQNHKPALTQHFGRPWHGREKTKSVMESAPKQHPRIQPSGNNTPKVPHALRTYFIWMFLKPTQANAFVLPVSLLSFLPPGLKAPESYSALASLLNLSFPE